MGRVTKTIENGIHKIRGEHSKMLSNYAWLVFRFQKGRLKVFGKMTMAIIYKWIY